MAVKKIEEIEREKVNAGEGTSRQILIGPDEAPNFVMRKFVIKPGGSIPAHTNTVEHGQYVLGGKAKIEIGDEIYEVEKDNVVFIPAGVPHWYEVEGSEPFQFLCMVPNGDDTIKIIE